MLQTSKAETACAAGLVYFEVDQFKLDVCLPVPVDSMQGTDDQTMPWRFPPAYLPCRGISFGFFSGWEESVRKRDVVDAHHPWIRRKLGIQIEEDRHIDLFFRL